MLEQLSKSEVQLPFRLLAPIGVEPADRIGGETPQRDIRRRHEIAAGLRQPHAQIAGRPTAVAALEQRAGAEDVEVLGVEVFVQQEALAGVALAVPAVRQPFQAAGWTYLVAQGLSRNIVVRASHFSLIPLMVADSLLVLTTGRLFCSRYVDTLPVRIVRCPVTFPPLTYYQLWHDVTHASPPAK